MLALSSSQRGGLNLLPHKSNSTSPPAKPGDYPEYLFGEKIILAYKILWICGIFAGSLAELNVIWNIADILNGFMAIPNIVAVLLLSGTIAHETKKYAGKHIDDKDESQIPVLRNSKKGVLC
ncbi:MAG: alanine:cation symporter family protein [Deltaproteobacteria bacterium]|nr:alanine:cation symporter family protein [Deltaproteobacteria bacterium]